MDMRFLLIILFLALAGVIHQAGAEPLTEARVRGAKRIVIVPGTFDPFTKGHAALVDTIYRASAADFVLVLPEVAPVSRRALPYSSRIQLIEAALESIPNALYAKSGTLADIFAGGGASALVRELRRLNPTLEIDVGLGSDTAHNAGALLSIISSMHPRHFWISRRPGIEQRLELLIVRGRYSLVGEDVEIISSTAARRFFSENAHLYFEASLTEEQLPQELLENLVSERILHEGLYLGTEIDRTIPLSRRLLELFMGSAKGALERFGLYDSFKGLMVSFLRDPELTSLGYPKELNITVLKQLGRGITGTAYLVDSNGTKMVLKVTHDQQSARDDIKRTVLQHGWFRKTRTIDVPEVFLADADGRWMLSEFVEGKNVAKTIHAGEMTRERLASVRALYLAAKAHYKETGVFLDLGPDNILIKGDEAYLIDLGPIAPMNKNFPEFLELYRRWESFGVSREQIERECGARILNG